MKKLTKAQLKQRDELISLLESAKAEVEEKYEEFNQKAQEAWDEVQEKLTAYNAVLEKARGFVDDIVGHMQDYIDSRSERWQESSAADSYRDWQSDWEGIDLDEVEPNTEFEPLDPPDMDHAQELSELPEERE